MNKNLPLGGLPAGVSDSDGISDMDDTGHSDENWKLFVADKDFRLYEGFGLKYMYLYFSSQLYQPKV